MFIRKKNYKELLARVDNLETAISRMAVAQSEREREINEALGGVIVGHDELLDDIGAVKEVVLSTAEKLLGFDEYMEQTEEDRLREREYFTGLQNVFGFGVKNGK